MLTTVNIHSEFVYFGILGDGIELDFQVFSVMLVYDVTSEKWDGMHRGNEIGSLLVQAAAGYLSGAIYILTYRLFCIYYSIY